MIYGILGDIHANLEALNAVIDDANKYGVKCFYSTGDIVGYNADPSACLNRLTEIDCKFVKGNHDEYCSSNTPLNVFNPKIQETLKWTRKKLKRNEKALLKNAPLILDVKNFTLVHSSLYHPSQWNYVLDNDAATDHFRNQFKPICFIGHSHIPTAFVKSNLIEQGLFEKLEIKDDHRYIINVGSVGQPRDHNPDAAYVIYDDDNSFIQLRRVSYNTKLTQKKIRNAGLPFRNALRLDRGR